MNFGYESYIVTDALIKSNKEEAISNKHLNAKLIAWGIIGAICVIAPIVFTLVS